MTAKKTTQIELAPSELTPTEVAPGALAQVMEVETERRALITKFIKHHMKEGTDYGTIRIGGRDSKPSLFKPGSEKFLSLFKLTATFRKDGETWEMAGSPKGLFCYVCEIKTSKGVIVGEGRGAAALTEKSWTINSCLKIAQKRAQVDAVLRMGALSDFFTQDLEDMVATKYDHTPVEDEAEVTVSGADEEAEPELEKGSAFLRQRIVQLLKARGVDITSKQACETYVADHTQLALTERNFKAIIDALINEK